MYVHSTDAYIYTHIHVYLYVENLQGPKHTM